MSPIIASAETAELILKLGLEAGAALGVLGLVTLAGFVIVGAVIAALNEAGKK